MLRLILLVALACVFLLLPLVWLMSIAMLQTECWRFCDNALAAVLLCWHPLILETACRDDS